jgi:hypothetical protein
VTSDLQIRLRRLADGRWSWLFPDPGGRGDWYQGTADTRQEAEYLAWFTFIWTIEDTDDDSKASNIARAGSAN